MTDKQIEDMVLDIVGEVDYDEWEFNYNRETSDRSPEETEENIAALVKIVRQHLQRSMYE